MPGLYGAVATQLSNAFHVCVENRNHPHATETLLFGWYISEDELAELMRRLTIMLMPGASQRVGNKSILAFHVHQMAVAPKPFAVAPTDPMSPKMCE